MKVLVITGHPRVQSFSTAISIAFIEGAREWGANVRHIQVAQMDFLPNVIQASPRLQNIEPDIQNAMESIAWADHLVFVYPTWWGTMPALLKAFLDRVFMPGFAFEEIEGGTGFVGFLKEKTAQIITTMDTPWFVYRFIYKAPGHRALAEATLKFCGVSHVKKMAFGPVKGSDMRQREKWLEKAKACGKKLEYGSMAKPAQIWHGILPWLKALRLQFYPMTAMAYGLGALLAIKAGLTLNFTMLWLGYLWLFITEVATVMSNDYFDVETDRRNRYFGPFTGGSRVVVENTISLQQLKRAMLWMMVVSGMIAVSLAAIATAGFITVSVLLTVSFIMALGYTVPPLKLSYKGLGEMDVALTHSLGAILCGFVLQGGDIFNSLPWLAAVPIGLAILPSIILSGVPDREADASVSKKTIAVRLGRKNTFYIAAFFTLLAMIVAICWEVLDVVPGLFNAAVYLVLPYALFLANYLYKQSKLEKRNPRIDGAMALSLAYILWFVIIPLFTLW